MCAGPRPSGRKRPTGTRPRKPLWEAEANERETSHGESGTSMNMIALADGVDLLSDYNAGIGQFFNTQAGQNVSHVFAALAGVDGVLLLLALVWVKLMHRQSSFLAMLIIDVWVIIGQVLLIIILSAFGGAMDWMLPILSSFLNGAGSIIRKVL